MRIQDALVFDLELVVSFGLNSKLQRIPIVDLQLCQNHSYKAIPIQFLSTKITGHFIMVNPNELT